ncbi:MAG: S41 family peptidase [bacterium]
MSKKHSFNFQKITKKIHFSKIMILLTFVIVYLLGVNVGNGNIGLGTGKPLNEQLSSKIDYSSVNQLYELLRNNYDGKLNNSQVLDGLKTGLANSTNDPYTEYFSPSQTTDFNNQLNESFSGIGAEMGKNDNNQIIIVSPISGFPADKAGLHAKDIITAINGESTSAMSVDTAVGKIRGPANTNVKLDIIRGGNQQLTFNIKREKITLPSVKSKTLDGNIGYISINQFTQDTNSLATKAAQQFKSQNVKGIVLDLRGNPGGLVDAAVGVCNLWLKSGQMIMQEKKGNQVINTYTADGANNILNGIPTVVLVDGGSASASEITAGALHDNNAATIVGEKSFGKGVVQQIFNLSGGAEAKITVAKWYRPNGKNIQHVGITPDKNVTNTKDQVSAGTDSQLDTAKQILQNQ